MASLKDGDLADVLVEVSPNGVLVTDGDGVLLRVNPACARLVPMVGQPEGRLAKDAVLVQAIVDALDPGAPDTQELVINVGHKELLVRTVPLTDQQGDGPKGRLALVEDVTRLRQAERYRSEFVANVSHELRTPATAIAGYAETLLEDRDQLDDYVGKSVEVIYRNARRLTELFDDLLYLSRIDAKEGPLPLSPLSVAPVIAEALDKVASAASAKEITLQTFGPDTVRVIANREALGHVVTNLVQNAVKYSHQGGVVTVGCRRRGRGWRLEVIDVGIGIETSHHDRVFERFYRVDKGRARAAGGTGLGLAIVKRLCDKMGAELSLRSQLGSGSVFRVLLPDADAPDLG